MPSNIAIVCKNLQWNNYCSKDAWVIIFWISSYMKFLLIIRLACTFIKAVTTDQCSDWFVSIFFSISFWSLKMEALVVKYEQMNVRGAPPAEQMKSVYKKLALELHPDNNPESEEEFKAVGQNNSCLLVDPSFASKITGRVPKPEPKSKPSQPIFEQVWNILSLQWFIRNPKTPRRPTEVTNRLKPSSSYSKCPNPSSKGPNSFYEDPNPSLKGPDSSSENQNSSSESPNSSSEGPNCSS